MPYEGLDALNAWALNPQRVEEEPGDYLSSLVHLLNTQGVEIGLATACIRTRHPQLEMLVLRWRPLNVSEVLTEDIPSILTRQTIKREGGVLDIYPLAHGHTDEELFRKSPFFEAINENKTIRLRLAPPPEDKPYPIVEDLIERGMTDYAVFPLQIGREGGAAFSLASTHKDGFPEAFLEAFKAFLPILSLSTSHKVERVQFREILGAYIGSEPAELVLKGQIKRGDLVSKRAVLGFVDLRGFTAASEELEAKALLNQMSRFFEFVYEALHEVKGEILKFMGDGVLFMIAEKNSPEETCNRALSAMDTLNAKIKAHNAEKHEHPIAYGCGLHFGDVLYGNIGAPVRLDFTVVGSAVNLTSRLEGLTAHLGESCLISKVFADLCSRQTRLVGEFNLKGIPEAQQVFTWDPESRA